MKIAIDALGIHYYGGGRSATLNLLEALFALDRKNEYTVFLTQPEPTLQPFSSNVKMVIAPVKNRFSVRLWAQMTIPRYTRNFSLIHFMKDLGVVGVTPPTVTTVYDLSPLVFPDFFPKLDVFYWRTAQRLAFEQSKALIAISQNTANDLSRFYNLSPQKIHVIYPAYASHFQPASIGEIERVRKQYALPERYVLTVSRIDRKKNLPLLVSAFAKMQGLIHFSGKLVVVGQEYRKLRDPALFAMISQLGLSDRIIFTGAVPDQDLPAIVSGATVACSTSLYEGFGIAPLEAMACGVPVIAYRAGAVGEVVGDAGIVLNRPDVEMLADALILVVQQAHLRQEMSLRSLQRAQNFSWRDSAYQTWSTYQQLV